MIKAGYNIGFATSGADFGFHTVLHFITFSAMRQVVAFYAPPDAKP